MSVDFTQINNFIYGAQLNAQRRIQENRKSAIMYIVSTLNAFKQLRDYNTLVAEQARRSREGDAEMASKLEAIFALITVLQVCLSILVHPVHHPELSESEVLDILNGMSQYSKETQVKFAESILDKYAEGKAGPTRGGLLTKPVEVELSEYILSAFVPKLKKFIETYGDEGYSVIVFKKVLKSVQDLIKLDRSQRQSQLEALGNFTIR